MLILVPVQTLLDRCASDSDDLFSKLVSVTSKIEWYIGLSRLCSSNAQDDMPIPFPSLPHDALIALYGSVLAFYMHSVAHICLGSRRLGRISFKLHLNEISASEKRLLDMFGTLRLQSQLAKVRKTAGKTEEDEMPAERELQDLSDKLKMDRNLFSTRFDDKYGMGELLYDLAMKTAEFQDFVNWNDKDCCRILWLNGCPGSGKSMLMETAVQRLPTGPESNTDNHRQSAYYFCDNTSWKQGDALSAVKGLICGVLHRQPDLRKHLSDAVEKREVFNSPPTDFHYLSNALYKMIQDEQFIPTYFLVRGIDHFLGDTYSSSSESIHITDEEVMSWDPQGKNGLAKLLRLISTTVDLTDKVKWALSVDHEKCHVELTSIPAASQKRLILDSKNQNLHENIARVFQRYAASMVAEIGQTARYRKMTAELLTQRLRDAPSNFLWAELALTIVQGSTMPWNAVEKLDDLIRNTPNIESLYASASRSICELPNTYKDDLYCKSILSAMATAHRPLRVLELMGFVQLPLEVDLVTFISTRLPVFLKVLDEVVYFRHPAGRDYIRRSIGSRGLQSEHSKMSQRCLKLVLADLKCNHGLIDTDKKAAETCTDYAMTMWARHLSKLGSDDPEAIKLAVHLLSVHLIDWMDLPPAEETVRETLSMLSRLNAAIGTKVSLPNLRLHRNAVCRNPTC